MPEREEVSDTTLLLLLLFLLHLWLGGLLVMGVSLPSACKLNLLSRRGVERKKYV